MNGRLARRLIKFHPSLASISPSKNVQHTSGFYWLVRADSGEWRLCLVRCATLPGSRGRNVCCFIWNTLWFLAEKSMIDDWSNKCSGAPCVSQRLSSIWTLEWKQTFNTLSKTTKKNPLHLFPAFKHCQCRWWARSKPSWLRSLQAPASKGWSVQLFKKKGVLVIFKHASLLLPMERKDWTFWGSFVAFSANPALVMLHHRPLGPYHHRTIGNRGRVWMCQKMQDFGQISCCNFRI